MARIDIKSSNTGGGGGGGNLQLASGASMTTTLTAVTDTSNVASPLKLSTAAVQVTSPLRITTSDASGFYLDAEDSATNNRFSIKRDPSSQEVTLDFASNPTGSTALVGAIRTYGDGVNLSNAMSFREDGNVGIGTDTPGAKLDIHSAGATVAQFNKTGSGNSYIQQLTAGAAKWKHGFTSASGAFDIIDDVNALTRLSLLNTGQLKLNAYTSTSAFTGTTAGFLAFDASGNILSVASPATSPSGVAGSVQFSDGSAFASDAANLFWDDTNNRLGIGTNAPNTALDISASLTSIFTLRNGATNFITTRSSGIGGLDTGFRIWDNSNNFTLDLYGSGSYDHPQRHRFYIGGAGTGERFLIGSTTAATIKGSGSTSATTSLLVQNSSGATAFLVRDDNILDFNGNTLLNAGSVRSNQVATGFINSAGNAYSVMRTNNSTGNATFDQFVAIGTTSAPNASAALDVVSTTKGFLPPRMTTAQKLAIGTPAAGLQVYDSTLNQMSYYNGTTWINF